MKYSENTSIMYMYMYVHIDVLYIVCTCAVDPRLYELDGTELSSDN